MTFVDEPVEVTIEQHDIDMGARRAAGNCPAALAIQRLYPGQKVRVGKTWVHIGGGFWKTPEALATFISDYDNGREVNPCSIILMERVPATAF